MKIIMFGGALAMLGGGFYAYKDRLITAPNVYAMPADQLYQRLDAMEIERSPQGPMGTLDVTRHGEQAKSITWSGAGAHAVIDCTATLVPLAEDRTRVDTRCGGGGPSEGAAAGMGAEMLRIAMVEQIDSTLRGRPYDKQKVSMASSGAMLRGLPQMQASALKMQHDSQQQVDTVNAQGHDSTAPASDPNIGTMQPGQPIDPKGTDPLPTAQLH